jgi:hypothetical protein
MATPTEPNFTFIAIGAEAEKEARSIAAKIQEIDEAKEFLSHHLEPHVLELLSPPFYTYIAEAIKKDRQQQAALLSDCLSALEKAAGWLPWHEPSHLHYEGERSDAGREVRQVIEKLKEWQNT